MSDKNDLGYYKRAELQARGQAANADSTSARIAHLARADEYAGNIARLLSEPHHGG